MCSHTRFWKVLVSLSEWFITSSTELQCERSMQQFLHACIFYSRLDKTLVRSTPWNLYQAGFEAIFLLIHVRLPASRYQWLQGCIVFSFFHWVLLWCFSLLYRAVYNQNKVFKQKFLNNSLEDYRSNTFRWKYSFQGLHFKKIKKWKHLQFKNW